MRSAEYEGHPPRVDGRLVAIDGRPALRFERRLDHSLERVWRAITEPAELARWFVAAVEWKLEPGEVFEAGGKTGEITDLRAPSVLGWEWGGQRFRFELEPGGNGCLLVFTHVFGARERAASPGTAVQRSTARRRGARRTPAMHR